MTIVYLLVEESFRELASRQAIAAECVALGYEVVIAQQWWFSANLGSLPAGIVLFKGNNRPQGALMAEAKGHGHAVTSIEEEAFGTVYEPEMKSLYDPLAVESADRLFVQGSIHRNFLAAWFPALRDKISVVGNPRTDILLHALGDATRRKAEDLRRQYGDFVLVNTNCASINPFDIDTYSYYLRCVDVGVLNPKDSEDIKRFDTLMSWEHSNLREMSRFLREFARIAPEIPVIVRPHPSENHRTWEAFVSGISNAGLVRDHDHIAWILAARAMLHTGCTTGLESALVGTASVGICPDHHPWHAGFISNLASIVRETGQDAAALCKAMVTGSSGNAEMPRDDLFRRLRPALEIDLEERSARRLAEALVDLRSPEKRATGATEIRPGMFERLSGRRHEKAFVEEPVFSATWEAMTNALGLARNTKPTEIAPSVFHIAAT
jgi:surface carbohydrate biosynthesis protein